MLPDLHMSYLVWKWKNPIKKEHWNILVFCDQRKMMPDWVYPLEKMSDFASFLLFQFTLVIKLRNFDFESQWNTLMSDFVSFLFFGFILVIKLRNFDFESYADTKIFFDKKKWCQIWICPVKQCLMLFKLCYLSLILAISWEKIIKKFIERV